MTRVLLFQAPKQQTFQKPTNCVESQYDHQQISNFQLRSGNSAKHGFKPTHVCPRAIYVHCGTKLWGSRRKALNSLVETFEFALDALTYIDLTDKTQAGAKAKPHYNSIHDFEFVFVLHLLQQVYEITGILVLALKSHTLEMDRLQRLVQSTKSSLEALKTDAEFEKLLESERFRSIS